MRNYCTWHKYFQIIPENRRSHFEHVACASFFVISLIFFVSSNYHNCIFYKYYQRIRASDNVISIFWWSIFFFCFLHKINKGQFRRYFSHEMWIHIFTLSLSNGIIINRMCTKIIIIILYVSIEAGHAMNFQ